MGDLDRMKTALADRYRLERELGAGGMAVVWLARDLKHDRDVALKVLRPELAASIGADRFLAEIRLTARLQHPHIVPLFDSGAADGFLYYVMPWIEGESLRARLEREKRLDVEAVLAIARPVAQALAYAHELGIVHRDIKPENILLSRGQPFVADFGIARALTVAGGERLTATGVALGTPAYMSPEQLLADAVVDGRSDLYSLGCVIYEMLAGSPPFSGATVQALLARRVSGPPPRLTNVPAPVDEVVRKSLAAAPQDRFATALALADALVEAVRRPATAELSIVVLPFENLSPDPDQEYFADGLTEEVISDLSAVRALQVISRSSAMTFKGSGKRAPAIAGELNVRYVLEGSVRRAGDSLRITAQLIDAATDTHLWSGKYPGTVEDVFDIQEKVAAAIVEELRLTLTPDERRRMAERPIEDVRAHEWYLKAMDAVRTFTAEGFDRALVYLAKALEISGPNARLEAGLAFAHWQMGNRARAPVRDRAMQTAREHVARALALNPESSEALAAQGWIEFTNGEVQAGVRTLKRALQHGPDDQHALVGLATAYIQHVGAIAEAAPLVELTVRRDPFDFMAGFGPAAMQFYAGDYAGAARGIADSPTIWHSIPAFGWFYGLSLASAGQGEEARGVLDALVQQGSDDNFARMGRMLAFALAGDRSRVEEELASGLREVATRVGVVAYHVAQPLALVGAEAEALAWLAIAVTRGFSNWQLLERDPLLAGVRKTDRFARIVARGREAREQFEL